MARAAKKQTGPGYSALRAAVKKGEIYRLYVLSGEENFLMERFVLLLEQTVIRPEAITLDKVAISSYRAGSQLTIDRLQAEVMTPPFLSERRLVIVSQSGWFAPARGGRGNASNTVATKTAEDADSEVDDTDSVEDATPVSASAAAGNLTDQLIALLNALPDSVCLVFCEQKVDKRLKRLITAVEQNGILGVFEQEDPATLIQWIEAETRHRGFRIDPVTASSLIDRCDGSMQLIWNELSKIYLYLAGSSTDMIDLKLLEQLALPDLRGSVFDLTDAVSAGRTSRALTLLDTLIAQKQPVQLITFMLARHYRQLIVAKTLGSQSKIASQLKVMPFVAARLLKQAQSLSLTELESQYLACFEADLAVKTGRLPDRLALETLLISAGEAAKNPGKSRLN